ncbi:MAG: hypothetical protein ABH951_02240 [Patescibacteria group bacterium]
MSKVAGITRMKTIKLQWSVTSIIDMERILRTVCGNCQYFLTYNVYTYDCGQYVWGNTIYLPEDREELGEIISKMSLGWDDRKNLLVLNKEYDTPNPFIREEYQKKESKIAIMFQNIYTAIRNCPTIPDPTTSGYYSSDYGGEASTKIYWEKFFQEFSEHPVKTFKTIAKKLARQIEDLEEDKKRDLVSLTDLIVEKKFIPKIFEIVKGKTFTIGEGNYQGRPGCNSWNTKINNIHDVVVNEIVDLKKFAIPGCRFVHENEE